MAERIGIVTSEGSQGWARVVTDRKGGCGGCHSSPSGCRSCLTSSKMESRATNDVGARNGDVVKLTLPSSAVFKGAALLYLLPIIALLAGAFAGLWVGGLWGWPDGSGAVVGSLIGLGLSVWAVIRLGRSPLLMRQMTPSITGIVQRAVIPQTGNPGHRPAHPKTCCG